MSMSSDGSTTRSHPPAPNAPLVVDPAEPVSVDMVKIGPGGKVLAPVLVFPGGVRVCIDAFSTDIDAAEWWKELGVAAMFASLCYQDGSEPVQ